MGTSKVLSRSSLPATRSPFHHRNITLELTKINELLEKSGLSGEDRQALADSIAKVATSCVKDAEDRIVV
jgi:hypothetical protein